MGNYTKMPSSLSEPWVFPDWDIEKDFFEGCPWEYNHFRYRDNDGEGKYLVFNWRNAFDEGGYDIICGEIHRFKDQQKAVAFCKSLSEFHSSHYKNWGGGRFVLDCHGEFSLKIPRTFFGDKLSSRYYHRLWRE